MEESRSEILRHCKGTSSSSSPKTFTCSHDRNTRSGFRRAVHSPDIIATNEYSHGDLLFAFYDDVQLNGNATVVHPNGATLSGDVAMSSTSEVPEPKSPVIPQKRTRGPVKQDAVDDFLEKQDGKISRKRDPKLCKHGPKGMCDYCMPLEVFPPNHAPNILAIRFKVP